MSLMTATGLSKFYGADEIFSNIRLDIPPKSRIALVGPNGAGKSTLVNLLIRADTPTEGTIHNAKDLRIAFLPQRPELAGNHTLWDEQLKAFDGLRETEIELADLAMQMADPDTHDAALTKYGPMQEEFERLGGYTYETRIKMVLTGVGFTPEEYDIPLTRLSGGQKTRAMLSRLLLEEPDLLVLDEPTNHLDIHAIEWLENFLRGFPGAVLAVSHDRYFIDAFANVIWEMEFKTLDTYRGNYTHYLQQREERRELLQKEYEAQQEFIAKEQAYIRKHMGSRWTAQAKGRLKKLETMKKRGKIIERGPKNRKSMHLGIEAEKRSGDKVL
ncbi:MAG: ABC-F family ATP-binding cassette domain-containing protein, partial [Aggregatilineales bacterium]